MSQTVLSGEAAEPSAQFELHRRELTAFCYRMLGSVFEAEDAVQETLLRAWRGFDGFQGRASVRSWLYRIATNVCVDMARGRARRARPMDLGPAGSTATGQLLARPHEAWLEPVPERMVLPDALDPADVAVERESVRLAFVAALQQLPARQRAVLILREVLRWPAAEVAELLDTSVASVNSALQRARATLDVDATARTDVWRPLDAAQQELVRRYVEAFEAYDLDALTALLHHDVVQTMPPYDLWLTGHDEIRRWYLGPGIGCQGSRLVPVVANGSAAFGQYKPGPDGRLVPWALQVVETREGAIAVMNAFLDTERLFPLFGLPAHLDR